MVLLNCSNGHRRQVSDMASTLHDHVVRKGFTATPVPHDAVELRRGNDVYLLGDQDVCESLLPHVEMEERTWELTRELGSPRELALT